jgi:hypothetical protein
MFLFIYCYNIKQFKKYNRIDLYKCRVARMELAEIVRAVIVNHTLKNQRLQPKNHAVKSLSLRRLPL